MATPASAAEACPTTATAPVVSWQTLMQEKALTLCRGVDAAGGRVMDVQVVDFEAGGKMRVQSDPPPAQPVPSNSTRYRPKTASEWHTWVRYHNVTPDPAQLFSVTNGSPYRTESFGVTMSFPQKKANALISLGNETICIRDSAGASGKRYFGLSDPRGSGRQYPYIATYSDPCQSNLARVTEEFSTYGGTPVNLFDATVAYHPLLGSGSIVDRRTFIGTRSTDGLWTGTQDRAYLLTSERGLTIHQARDTLINDFRTMYNMRLDGGGATQYHTGIGSWGLRSLDNPERMVPEVLAIYQAP